MTARATACWYSGSDRHRRVPSDVRSPGLCMAGGQILRIPASPASLAPAIPHVLAGDQLRCHGIQHLDYVAWRELHLQAALATIHIDQGLAERTGFQRHGHALHLPEGTDATHLVTGEPL